MHTEICLAKETQRETNNQFHNISTVILKAQLPELISQQDLEHTVLNASQTWRALKTQVSHNGAGPVTLAATHPAGSAGAIEVSKFSPKILLGLGHST